MYRNCIFCSARLGLNESIEHFPVGRSLAFDGEKGRLWAVCPRCARWNLAPLEERWEAIEEAERLFRDTRLRAQRENIGLARLRDGTRLIRVGQAVEGELAVWRYGESLVRRRWRHLLTAGPSAAAGVALYAYGLAATTIGAAALYATYLLGSAAYEQYTGHKLVYPLVRDGAGGRAAVLVRRRHLSSARLGVGEDGVELHLPDMPANAEGRRFSRLITEPLVVRGADARMALGRAMAVVNARGGTRGDLNAALAAIRSAGSPAELLLSAGRQGLRLDGAPREGTHLQLAPQAGTRAYWTTPVGEAARQADQSNPLMALAVEMALHEETERRALEGELAALEAMWRQAEEIAAIADRLPDSLPAAESPRVET
jgi:hypothetical protein